MLRRNTVSMKRRRAIRSADPGGAYEDHVDRRFGPRPGLGFGHACATVTGTVKGPDGTPFRGAFVQAQHAGTKITTSVLSDRQGRYRFDNLSAGTYQLRVRAVGYDRRSAQRRER